MLLELLAADPACPPALLSHLTQHAAGDVRAVALRASLIANTTLTLAERRALLAGVPAQARATILRSALASRHLSTDDALLLIGDERSAAVLSGALEVAGDPDGRIAALVVDRTGGPSAWAKILGSRTAAVPTKIAAARGLAAHPSAKPTSYTRKDIVNLVLDQLHTAQTPEQKTAATDLHRELSATGNAHLAADLRKVRPAAVLNSVHGSPEWLAHPSTPADDLVGWARRHGGGTRAWAQVLKLAADPAGDVARRAHFDRPDSVTISRIIVMSNAPLRVRQRAAMHLSRATGGHTQETSLRLQEMFTYGEGSFVDWHIRNGSLSRLAFSRIAAREDTTAERLNALTSRQLAGNVGSAAARVQMWGVTLATHPVATAAQRLQGLELTRAPIAQDTPTSIAGAHAVGLEVLPLIAAAAAGVDPADPASPARAGRQLPLGMLSHAAILEIPGVRWLLAAGLASLLEDDVTADIATALSSLAGDLSDTTTLAELFTTAQAIAG